MLKFIIWSLTSANVGTFIQHFSRLFIFAISSKIFCSRGERARLSVCLVHSQSGNFQHSLSTKSSTREVLVSQTGQKSISFHFQFVSTTITSIDENFIQSVQLSRSVISLGRCLNETCERKVSRQDFAINNLTNFNSHNTPPQTRRVI